MTDTAITNEPRTSPAPLTILVVRGLAALGDLRTLHPDVQSGEVERGLRVEVDRLTQNPSMTPTGTVGAEHPAVAAVRTACAHLATRAYEDAYLALGTARSLLPHHPVPNRAVT